MPPRRHAVGESRQTGRVIDPRFVFLAIAVSLFGTWGYVRDTLRGTTSPHRVTWSLWGLEGVLTFIVEIQAHVGLASLMTLTMGFVPLVVVAVSFRNPHAVWQINGFDVLCGLVSVLGLVLWCFVDQATLALILFVAADQVAALPTLRKSWLVPHSETSRAYFMGSANCAITLLTLRHFTTAGVLFPGCILVTDLFIGALVATRLGPRLRGDVVVGSTPGAA